MPDGPTPRPAPEGREERRQHAIDLYRQSHDAGNQEKLSRIPDPDLRAATAQRLEDHYSQWSHSISKAYARRYDDSHRFYERKIEERKIDQRLIPTEAKELMREQAIGDAAGKSRATIDDINSAFPRMIERTLDHVLKAGQLPDRDEEQRADRRARDKEELAKRLSDGRRSGRMRGQSF